MLRYCKWQNNNPVDVGIWFPFGQINQAFQTDFPIANHPYTLGNSTYHIWGSAPKHATRNRGKSPNWIIGGVHFTHYGFLVSQVLKSLSCTECGEFQIVSLLHKAVKMENWKELEQELSQVGDLAQRIIPLDQLDPLEHGKIEYRPWFYNFLTEIDTVCGKAILTVAPADKTRDNEVP